ncbi:MAG: winged helix-turn-helix domain-containing protein [Rhodanobacteraceae bacterium]|nr:winged helix-turn-helix domain-containing protein [Rhodanobacteraceae bacterium]
MIRYRFAGVEVDPAGFSVRIDGLARDCSRKAFDLIWLMCRSEGQLLSRDEVTSALWPGGQLVSDEALTQIVFRARAVLGPYGALLRTIRGVGLKLEAEILIEHKLRAVEPSISPSAELNDPNAAEASASDQHTSPTCPVTAQPDDSDQSQQAAPAASTRWRQRRWAVLAVAAALAVWWLARLMAPAPPGAAMLDEGYGLRLSDVKATHADTITLLSEALDNEASGERARASILMTRLHETDLSTPVPAIYLAIWSKGDGHRELARTWLSRARARLEPSSDLYYLLWLAFVDAEINQGAQAVVDAAGALLDLRQDAWRMRHARAHLMESMGMRRAALFEISQIEVLRLGHRKRDTVIADRASMGDIEGAQKMLDRLDPASDPTMHSFLAGRLAWSRGDWPKAHSHFSRAAGSAFDIARFDLQTRALSYAGAIELLGGDDETAMASFESARVALAGRNAIADADLSLLIAQLHMLAGRPQHARQELARAQVLPQAETAQMMPLAAQFVAWRLFPDTEAERPAQLTEMNAALWAAHEALRAGATDRARAELARSKNLGIGSSRFADEARWLELKLGLPVSQASKIDPPYPPLSRVILRREIRRALAATSTEPGPEMP